MKKVFFPLFLVFLSVSGTLSAQLPALRIDSLTVDNDTIDVAQGETTFTYSYKITNVGTVPYSGSILSECIYSADPGNVWFWESVVYDSLLPGQFITISNHTDNVLDAPMRYSGGENIITVWPHSGSEAQIPDTTTIQVWILNITSRPEPQPIENRVSVFPNPVSDLLKLNWKNSGQSLEYVRLTNLSGQEIFSSDIQVAEVPVGHLPPGLYLLEINYSDGLRGFFRISKE